MASRISDRFAEPAIPREAAPQTVRRLRAAAGWSTHDLAARLSRSSRTVEDWEQGRRLPDKLVWQTLLGLAKKMKISLDQTTAMP